MENDMTEQKHTPRPWKYVETQSPCGQEWLGCGVVEGDHEFVWLEGDPEFDIPRAHLIAAAPDMLEALEIMCNFVETGSWPDRDPVQIARAAIAKAKGETA